MFGITTFAGEPFSSLADIAEIVEGKAVILGTADLSALGGIDLYGQANIYAIAELEVDGIDQNGGKANITANAILIARANHKVVGIAMIDGVATLIGKGGITGEGWVRVQPNTDEWDFKESSDGNKIS